MVLFLFCFVSFLLFLHRSIQVHQICVLREPHELRNSHIHIFIEISSWPCNPHLQTCYLHPPLRAEGDSDPLIRKYCLCVYPIDSFARSCALTDSISKHHWLHGDATIAIISPVPTMANSARKGRQAPNLYRDIASPSRGHQLSMRFRHASDELQVSSPSLNPTSHSSRIPLSSARHTRFGESQAIKSKAPYSYRRRIPLSSTRHTRFGESQAIKSKAPYSYRSPPRRRQQSDVITKEKARDIRGLVAPKPSKVRHPIVTEVHRGGDHKPMFLPKRRGKGESQLLHGLVRRMLRILRRLLSKEALACFIQTPSQS